MKVLSFLKLIAQKCSANWTSEHYVPILYYKFNLLNRYISHFFANVTLCARRYMCLEISIMQFTKSTKIIFWIKISFLPAHLLVSGNLLRWLTDKKLLVMLIEYQHLYLLMSPYSQKCLFCMMQIPGLFASCAFNTCMHI